MLFLKGKLYYCTLNDTPLASYQLEEGESFCTVNLTHWLKDLSRKNLQEGQSSENLISGTHCTDIVAMKNSMLQSQKTEAGLRTMIAKCLPEMMTLKFLSHSSVRTLVLPFSNTVD